MKLLRTSSFITQLIFRKIQKIDVDNLPKGSVLDIGGGGEGIIAQVGRDRITVVDKYQSEIDQAKHKAPEAKWRLADATKLDFSDAEFDNATAFFSIMYMSNEDKVKVFKEVYRVIGKEGEFWIWDTTITKVKGVFLIKLMINLQGRKTVRTAYGVSSKMQSADSVSTILDEVGFKVEKVEENKGWYLLKARKQD